MEAPEEEGRHPAPSSGEEGGTGGVVLGSGEAASAEEITQCSAV